MRVNDSLYLIIRFKCKIEFIQVKQLLFRVATLPRSWSSNRFPLAIRISMNLTASTNSTSKGHPIPTLKISSPSRPKISKTTFQWCSYPQLTRSSTSSPKTTRRSKLIKETMSFILTFWSSPKHDIRRCSLKNSKSKILSFGLRINIRWLRKATIHLPRSFRISKLWSQLDSTKWLDKLPRHLKIEQKS
jgi:hypothetical protein